LFDFLKHNVKIDANADENTDVFDYFEEVDPFKEVITSLNEVIPVMKANPVKRQDSLFCYKNPCENGCYDTSIIKRKRFKCV